MIEQNKVADALIRHRERRNLSRASVAEVTGISASTLWRFEGGERNLDANNLLTLALYLGLPLNGYAVHVEVENTIDAVCDIIRVDSQVEQPEGLCRLMRAAYKEMVGLASMRKVSL